MQGRSECEVWVQRVQPIGWGLGQCWVGVSKLVLTSGARFSILREGSGAGSRSHGGTLGSGVALGVRLGFRKGGKPENQEVNQRIRLVPCGFGGISESGRSVGEAGLGTSGPWG